MERLGPKLYSWASFLEDGTREQAERTAAMPFIHPHLALMPDAHLGKGATVGRVIPTDGAIMPAAVGRGHRLRDDGGADRSSRRRPDGSAACGELHASIARRVPLSAGRNNRKVERDRRAAGRAS